MVFKRYSKEYKRGLGIRMELKVDTAPMWNAL